MGIIDPENILNRTMGDRDLMIELIDMFISSHADLIDRCRQAIADDDAGELASAAHSLKGGMGNFDPDEGYELARKLEMVGREGGDMTQATKLLEQIEEHTNQLAVELTDLKEGRI